MSSWAHARIPTSKHSGSSEQIKQGHVPTSCGTPALEAMRKLLGDNDLLAYLTMMSARMVELRRVLKPAGSLYLHCDPTASHYLKILLDAVLGPEQFRNEVIWQRTATKGDARRKFGSVHDTLLFYGRSNVATFHAAQLPHHDAYRARFRFDDHDGRGPYRDAPLDSPNPRPNLTYVYKGYPPPLNGWRVNRELMEQLDADRRLISRRQPRVAFAERTTCGSYAVARSAMCGPTFLPSTRRRPNGWVTRRKSRSICWNGSSRRRVMKATWCSIRSAGAVRRSTPHRSSAGVGSASTSPSWRSISSTTAFEAPTARQSPRPTASTAFRETWLALKRCGRPTPSTSSGGPCRSSTVSPTRSRSGTRGLMA